MDEAIEAIAEGTVTTEAATTERTDEDRANERGLANAPMTGALIATNIGVFVAQVFLAGSPRFALGAGAGHDANVWSDVLRWLGANHSTFTIADNRLETLVTSSFLHGSALHLAFNMVVLYQVGPFLERAAGRVRFLPLYLGAGIAANAVSAIAGRFIGATFSFGASGNICGLIGAVLVVGARTQGWRGPLARQMAIWLAILFLLGLARNMQGGLVQIDNAAHLGGTVGGIVIASAWQRGREYSARVQNAVVAACVALVAISGITVYVRDRTDPYLFMDVEERYNAAVSALGAGRCEKAQNAIKRARQMDPENNHLRAHAEQIERECAKP
jgi:rhomboid protease GluP